MSVDLVLTDDWELRGDGSGDMRTIQFAQMRRLREIMETHGLRLSFFVEAMQQLAHLENAGEHSELARLATEWEEIVCDTYARGHDVQLHVHPQWSRAEYADARWEVGDAWSLLDYPPDEARAMVRDCKTYLEGLVSRADSTYRCVAFRSSAWCVAPSSHMLNILIEAGIKLDTSIVAGVYFSTPHARVDYRTVDEPLLPYYPRLDDARRVAGTVQPIICVPTYSFRGSILREALGRAVAFYRPHRAFLRDFLEDYRRPCDTAVADAGLRADHRLHWSDSDLMSRIRRLTQAMKGQKMADLCTLTFDQTKEMLSSIRRRVSETGAERIPVILANHTKSIGDFGPLERFASEVAKAPDLNVITLTELAENLREGVYPVRAH